MLIRRIRGDEIRYIRRSIVGENLLFAIATWYSATHVVSKMATENVRADENRGRKYRCLSGESQDGNRFGRIQNLAYLFPFKEFVLHFIKSR